jgi:hypothetical protein
MILPVLGSGLFSEQAIAFLPFGTFELIELVFGSRGLPAAQKIPVLVTHPVVPFC